MKLCNHSLSAAKSLTGLLMLCCLAASAQAAAILTLTGKAADAKYEADGEVRLSLIDWSDNGQQEAVEAAYRQYLEDGDQDALLTVIEGQDSRGYLFTAAATGYRIKYAWKEQSDGGQRLHFIVTPGLKTRNPYLWNTPNNDSPDFSFVQVQMNEDTGVAKSSLEGEIGFNTDGRLQLESFQRVPAFATVQDSTPYYLK